MLLGHARVGVTELAGNHRHGDTSHCQERAVRVAQHVEGDRWCDAGARAGFAHGACLLGPLPGPPVVAAQERISRRAAGDQAIDEGTAFVRERDVAYLAAFGDAHAQVGGVVVGDLEAAQLGFIFLFQSKLLMSKAAIFTYFLANPLKH